MTDASAINDASRRLTLALDALAAAVERRQEADRGEATLDAQLHALEADRSRLAAELDDAAARAQALEHANREVARRLDAAIDTIRSVLAGNGAEPPQRQAGPS
jgi:septal ring factor EnvC (AmiA/AmiB activator)